MSLIEAFNFPYSTPINPNIIVSDFETLCALERSSVSATSLGTRSDDNCSEKRCVE